MRKKTAPGQFKDAVRGTSRGSSVKFEVTVRVPSLYTVYSTLDETPMFKPTPELNPVIPRLGRPVSIKDMGIAQYSLSRNVHIFHVGVYEPEDIDNLLMDLFDKYIGYGLSDL